MMTNWLCKTQPNVTFLAVEYQTLAMALQEILFQRMLLKELRIVLISDHLGG
jgi:hypothetical protein